MNALIISLVLPVVFGAAATAETAISGNGHGMLRSEQARYRTSWTALPSNIVDRHLRANHGYRVLAMVSTETNRWDFQLDGGNLVDIA